MYIEYLSCYNLIYFVFKYFLVKKINLKNSKIYYFDSSPLSKPLAKLVSYIFNINFCFLDFELINIKDHNKELIRLRIFRKDLIELQKNIIANNQIFKELKNDKHHEIYYNFLMKSLTAGHLTMNPESLVRAVFIIQVVLWHSKKFNISNVNFFMSNRLWFDELNNYANNYKIKIFKLPIVLKFYKENNLYFFNIRKNDFPLLIQIKSICKKLIKFKNPFIKYNINYSKLYSLRLGHYNLRNDGMNSDLFFFMNSTLNSKDIICEYNSYKQLKELKSNNFSILNSSIIFSKNYFFLKKKILFKKNKLSQLEFNFFKKNVKEFNYLKRKNYIFLKANNIKIFLTWAKFSKDHMAAYEAMKELGGIFAIWQYAFEGAPSITTQINTDVYFSNYSKNFFYKNNSNIKLFINTGFLMDYRFNLLKEKAKIIRNKLLNNGAKNIVAVFDENSHNKRWHTGHSLHAENYEHILKEVLKNNNLGVIFKPKDSKNLRERIGSVNELLVKAQATGRCFVYESSTDNFTSAPPVLAGLSADICIHGHLCSGTAAIECALANLPTLLIDREGSHENLLYSLSNENLIFNSWEETIYALKDHFNSKIRNNQFGRWPEYFLNDLDSFRDGKAAYRMGECLKLMMNEFKSNKKRDEILNIVAENYSKKYGKDKVFSVN